MNSTTENSGENTTFCIKYSEFIANASPFLFVLHCVQAGSNEQGTGQSAEGASKSQLESYQTPGTGSEAVSNTRDNLSAASDREREREREKIKVFSCVGRKKSGQ